VPPTRGQGDPDRGREASRDEDAGRKRRRRAKPDELLSGHAYQPARRGFAAMSPEKRQAAARRGGRVRQARPPAGKDNQPVRNG
jgi:hypothetical protein